MALIRIIECDYNVYSNSLVMDVEYLVPEDKLENTVYRVSVPVDRALTEADVKSYVQRDIESLQRAGIPDYSGLEWSTT